MVIVTHKIRKIVKGLKIVFNFLLGRTQRRRKGELRAGNHQESLPEAFRRIWKGIFGTDLYWYVRFYKAYPEIFASVSKKTLPTLSWTHYRVLLQAEYTKPLELVDAV
jgi:hypothetical protein